MEGYENVGKKQEKPENRSNWQLMAELEMPA